VRERQLVINQAEAGQMRVFHATDERIPET